MSKERTFKITWVIIIILLLIMYYRFIPEQWSKQKSMTAIQPEKVMMLIQSNYPAVRIHKDSLMYSKFGIFIKTHDEVTASYASTQSLEVSSINYRRISRVAWEILVMYSCVLFFFAIVGRATKLDRPPPFLATFLAIITFIIAFGMVFGLFTLILFAVCFLLVGSIITIDAFSSRKFSEWELGLGIETDTLMRIKLVFLFEVCFLISAWIALNNPIKPLNFGFEYQGWYFIGTVVVLSIVGFYAAYTFTKRKAILLEE